MIGPDSQFSVGAAPFIAAIYRELHIARAVNSLVDRDEEQVKVSPPKPSIAGDAFHRRFRLGTSYARNQRTLHIAAGGLSQLRRGMRGHAYYLARTNSLTSLILIHVYTDSGNEVGSFPLPVVEYTDYRVLTAFSRYES